MGGSPLRRHQALGGRHHRGALAQTGSAEVLDHLAQPARGHRQEHVVRARDTRGGGLDAQLRGQRHARQVVAVLALLVDQRRLLGGARLQRRAQPPAREQQRQRRAERPRADHRRAPAGGRQRAHARRASGGLWLGLGCHAAGERSALCDRGPMPEGDTIHHAAARIRAVLEATRSRGDPHAASAPPARSLAAAPGWARVRAVDAHGKHLFLRFDGGLTVHSHLRMTRLVGRPPRGRALAARAPASMAGAAPRRLGGGRVRRSGARADERRAHTHAIPVSQRSGQDVLGEQLRRASCSCARLRADEPGRPIGDALLNQRTVAGIGNVWKAECCFAVGIDPWRATC